MHLLRPFTHQTWCDKKIPLDPMDRHNYTHWMENCTCKECKRGFIKYGLSVYRKEFKEGKYWEQEWLGDVIDEFKKDIDKLKLS